MKKLILIFCCVGLLAFTTYEQVQSRIDITTLTTLTSKPIVKIGLEPIIVKPIETPKKSHSAFLNAIGFQESGNKYDVVNRFGYLGRYQFGKRTLRGLGFKVSKNEFLENPYLQEQAMLKLLQTNKKYLQKYIDQYEGQIVNGVLVTESGLLAAAHLGGAGSVKKWFKTGKVKKDGNGVKITSYMTRFGGYELNLNSNDIN